VSEQTDAGSVYETGWDTSWYLPKTSVEWGSDLQCPPIATWTGMPGGPDKENRPINCVTWYEAYAFCIWDGGFLPTEAEWNYVAAGGMQQCAYPWSNPPTNVAIDCSFANYLGGDGGTSCNLIDGVNAVGSRSPRGDGIWGHADLAGNLREWTLDFQTKYPLPCQNCTALVRAGDAGKVRRGGAFDNIAANVLVPDRFGADFSGADPGQREYGTGIRCARGPLAR
jgi:formylglycine-generating enzyme required for sulfatase activity